MIQLLPVILVNLVPLVAVLFFGWEVFPIMLLFWAENVWLGVLNVIRMLSCSSPLAAKLGLAFFFTLHYGLFCGVHGVFVWTLFGSKIMQGEEAAGTGLLSGMNIETEWIWGFLAIAFFQTLSFVLNEVANGKVFEYKVDNLMAGMYGRIVALHVAILLGGFAAMAMNSPVPALMVLIAIKSFVDISSEAKKNQPASLFTSPS